MSFNVAGIKAYASASEYQRFPKGPFLGVKCEKHGSYDIFWFVWEKDGVIPKQIIPQDWEPAILFYKNQNLVQVTVRRHFEWQDFYSAGDDVPVFTLPLTIIFTGSHHAPVVRNNWDTTFDDLQSLHYPLEFQVESVPSCPPYARRAIFKRKGIFLQRGQDIHERAKQTLMGLQ